MVLSNPPWACSLLGLCAGVPSSLPLTALSGNPGKSLTFKNLSYLISKMGTVMSVALWHLVGLW